MKMHNTAVLVTGAAGGLGKAIVESLYNLPDIEKIIAVDKNQTITGLFKDKPKVKSIITDVSSEPALKLLHQKLLAENIRIKYIINNAGIYMFHPVSEMTQELLDKILKVNTYAPVLTVSVFLDDLIQTQGRVVQISTCGVKFPTMFQSYPATKIAMEAFSTSMRQELDLLGVKVIFIRSGAINTGLLDEMKKLPVPVEQSWFAKYYQRFLDTSYKKVGKIIEPEIVANTVRKSLTAKNPKYIYHLNPNPTIRFLSLFPQKIRDRIVKIMVK